MPANVHIQSAPCFGCTPRLSGLGGFGAAPPPGFDVPLPVPGNNTSVGLVALTAFGVAGLGAGYWLYKKNHPVAGVVVALIFGSGAIMGPAMIAQNVL